MSRVFVYLCVTDVNPVRCLPSLVTSLNYVCGLSKTELPDLYLFIYIFIYLVIYFKMTHFFANVAHARRVSVEDPLA